MEITKVNELPADPKPDQIYEIAPDKAVIVASTHRLFNKYPTRYIPQVPRWGILNYSTEGDYVLDPFCGSGTTLVEAMLNGRNAISVDIDPFARLLTRVKTTKFTENDLTCLDQTVINIHANINNLTPKIQFPEIPSIHKWFSVENTNKLAILKSLIDLVENENAQAYLLIVFASIIRRCSNAESVSPKPYISTRFPKDPDDPFAVFFEVDALYRPAIESFKDDTENKDVENIFIHSNDAREIKCSQSVSLAITSPPYINAYDYVRILKFENMWLGLARNDQLVLSRKKYVGTENFSSFYINYEHALKSPTLAEIAPLIREVDKPRYEMVCTYFEDMALNMIAVRNRLKTDGRYIIVVGDSTIRNQIIPTGKILAEIAEKCGYEKELSFKYVIRDRYLHLPRGGRGGIIKYDEIVTLRKN
jgi:hypothetical protein